MFNITTIISDSISNIIIEGILDDGEKEMQQLESKYPVPFGSPIEYLEEIIATMKKNYAELLEQIKISDEATQDIFCFEASLLDEKIRRTEDLRDYKYFLMEQQGSPDVYILSESEQSSDAFGPIRDALEDAPKISVSFLFPGDHSSHYKKAEENMKETRQWKERQLLVEEFEKMDPNTEKAFELYQKISNMWFSFDDKWMQVKYQDSYLF